MNINEQIKEDLNRPSYYTDNAKIFECPNHIERRNFRMWIDGSYSDNGYQTYQHNIELLKIIKDSPKKLRAFVIHQFTSYTAHENRCSYGHAQKSIVDSLSRHYLERLNDELIDDALDLIEDLSE